MGTEENNSNLERLNETAKVVDYNPKTQGFEIEDSNKKRDYFITINFGSACYQSGKATYENMEEYLYTVFSNIAYACWDEEEGDNGNKHIHLFLSLHNAISFGSMRKKFDGANIQPKKGSAFFAVNYIRKPKGLVLKGAEKSHTQTKPMREIGSFDDIKEKGIYNKDGALTKPPTKPINEQIAELVKAYDTIEDIAAANPYLCNTYGKVIAMLLDRKKMECFLNNPQVEKVEGKHGTFFKVHKLVYYVYGQEGSGKSFSTRLEFGELGRVGRVTFDKGIPNFDNYHGEPVMYLNEFKGNIPLSVLQNLLEESIVMLDARYNDHLNLATTYIFDSNIAFEHLYSNVKATEPDKYKSFVRRFTGGVWETYQTNDGVRYIALHEELLPKSSRYGDKYDPSKLQPPFSEEWTGFKQIPLDQLNKIKTFESRYVYTEEKGQQVLRKDYVNYHDWLAEKTANQKLTAQELLFANAALENDCKQFKSEVAHVTKVINESTFEDDRKQLMIYYVMYELRYKYKKQINFS